jgi:hypothetical protein
MADEKLHATLQENLITLLCHSSEFGKQISLSLDPQLMEGDYRIIAERAVEYWRRYGEAPKDHTIDLVAHIIEDVGNRKGKTFQRILTSMEVLAPNVNGVFVIDQVAKFSHMQRLKDAILKSAERLNSAGENAVEEVEGIWQGLLRAVQVDFNPGMKLTDVDRMLEFLETHYSEFSTGITQFDRRMIVPSRGAIMLLLAPVGRGKSWGLINIGKNAVKSRKRVLHVTLEMPEDEVIMRYHQALWGMGKRHRKVKVARFNTDGPDRAYDELDNPKNARVLESIRQEELETPQTFKDNMVRDDLLANMGGFDGLERFENVRVVRFAPRSLTMGALRAYIETLFQTEGFLPDLLCLDYIGITKTDLDNHRLSLGSNMELFRGLCGDYNMAGVTASQVGRDGMKAENVRAIHAAEDISLINTSDVAITFSQTNAEKELGLARLFVDKCRSEDDKFGVLISQNYAMGQFCLESILLPKTYKAILKEFIGEDRSRSDDREEEQVREEHEKGERRGKRFREDD